MALPDLFTGSNGTTLQAYDALWVRHASYSIDFELASNRVKVKPGGTGAYFYNDAPAGADYDVSALGRFTSTSNNQGGVTGRMASGANTFYHARIAGSSVELYKFVAGSATLLGSVSHGITTGVDFTITLSMAGTTIRALIDGVQKVSVTDSSITAAGFAGLRILANASNIELDDFDIVVAGGGALAAEAVGAAVADGSATASMGVALAAAGVSVAGGTATAGVAVPLSASGLAVAGGGANAVATVTLSAAAVAQAAGTAGLSAEVLLAGAGAASAAGNAELATALHLLAAGAANTTGAASLSVSVTLQAVGGASAAGSATGSASSADAASASGGAQASGWASWSALVSVSAAGFVSAMGSGQLAIDVPLAALGGASASGQASPSLLGAVRNFALRHAVSRTTAARCQWSPTLQAETAVARLTNLTHGVRHG